MIATGRQPATQAVSEETAEPLLRVCLILARVMLGGNMSAPFRCYTGCCFLMIVATYYLCLVAVLSCISFGMYGWDKRQAILARRRVSEQTLHLLDLLGGWPGGLLGQQYFRHKTKKLSFLIRFWLTVLLHLAIVGAAGYENLQALTTP